ncbi:MAG TPA: ABC transporter ATP-binding protein [Firmicutes bacterium]|nr:ABC transporter ATP-binding protein [Bacillota bacterium]
MDEGDVEFQDVTKVYSSLTGRPMAIGIEDVSFVARRGEILTILGPNGAGKTTIIKLITGLLTPTSGVVRVGRRRDVEGKDVKPRRPGVVLGGARNLYWRLTARENLEYFGALRRAGSLREIARQSDELLRLFGLYEVGNRAVADLSTGLRQRLFIAVALMGKSDIVVFDEPTIGLDVRSSIGVEWLIKDISRVRGTTVILATHQMKLAQNVSDRVLIMNRGKVLLCDTVDNLRRIFKRDAFEIVVDGTLPEEVARCIHSINGLQIVIERDDRGCSRILAGLADSRLLYPLLDLLRANNLGINLIRRRDPDLEEVFLQVTA